MKNIIRSFLLISLLNSGELIKAQEVIVDNSAQELVKNGSFVTQIKEKIKKYPQIAIAVTLAVIAAGGFSIKYAYERHRKNEYFEESDLIFSDDFSKVPDSKKEEILNKNLANAKKYLPKLKMLKTWLEKINVNKNILASIRIYDPVVRRHLSKFIISTIDATDPYGRYNLASKYLDDVTMQINNFEKILKSDKNDIKKDQKLFEKLLYTIDVSRLFLDIK